MFIARNQKGELIKARSSCKEEHTTPEGAEAVGNKEALSWIKTRQLNEVTVETDCRVAVQAIRVNATMSSHFDVVI